jgi:hypothetical protein
MRSLFSSREGGNGGLPVCFPLVYLNGHYMGTVDGKQMTTDDIDDMVRPDEVYGIEVYTQGQVPPQFSLGMMAECGSIVIWSR